MTNITHITDRERAQAAEIERLQGTLSEWLMANGPGGWIDEMRADAERYRWLAGFCRSTPEHWGGRWSIVVEGPAPTRPDEEDAFDAAIDAAMKGQTS